VSADTKTTLQALRDKAIKQIKKEYDKDIPKDITVELEFEQVN
jgi:hypothetical protein